MTNPVSLSINGVRYFDWNDMAVMRSVERMPWEFEFIVENEWRGDNKRRIKRGDAVQVKHGEEVLISGYIDDVDPNYDATSHKLEIRGRSKLADLFDCTSFDKTFTDLSLAQIAKQICEPFGINVVDQAQQDAPFANKAISKGQDFWSFLEELARMRAVRLSDSPNGDLVLVQKLTEQAATPLVLGNNIVRARGTRSARELFSEYHVMTNDDFVGFGASSAKDLAHPAGSVEDAIKRYRPLVVLASFDANSADCAKRADLQKRVNRGRSEAITYSVNGWTQENQQTWRPGMKVQVRDEYAEINDVRTIMDVRSIMNDDGAGSEITVMPNYVLDLLPVPEEDDAEGVF